MPYSSLRDFIDRLEKSGRLARVAAPVSPYLEMTEIQTRLLAEGGPAALFENVTRATGGTYAMPVLVNLFGTVERVAWWAEIFETPCVAYAGALEAVAPLREAGADFVALGDAVWRAPSAAEAVSRAQALLTLSMD